MSPKRPKPHSPPPSKGPRRSWFRLPQIVRASSERAILFILASIQFINILDFMMVMPLGPDFAVSLGIPGSKLGYIGAAYTASAAIVSLSAARFLDRFDRKHVVVFCMLGLFLGTVFGGFAWNFESLIVARMVAGAFGGPASAACFSIVADIVPVQRRGRAMGVVMGAFAMAAVLGVPIALEIGLWGGWRAPFFVVAALGGVIGGLAWLWLPNVAGHIAASKINKHVGPLTFLKRRAAVLSLGALGSAMTASFIMIPNISSYIQFNLGYPRDKIGLLYLAGGSVNFFSLRLMGRLVDRFGPLRIGTLSSVIFILCMFLGFYSDKVHIPIALIFVLFMVSNGTRGVALRTLLSIVPAPHEQASFQSTQTAVSHMAAAFGAFLSSLILVEAENRSLLGMKTAVFVAVAFSAAMPLLLYACRDLEAKRTAASVEAATKGI